MDSSEVKTTLVIELEGKLCYAVSDKEIDWVEAQVQAEHLIPVELDGKQIRLQGSTIEYLEEGDTRPATKASSAD